MPTIEFEVNEIHTCRQRVELTEAQLTAFNSLKLEEAKAAFVQSLNVGWDMVENSLEYSHTVDNSLKNFEVTDGDDESLNGADDDVVAEWVGLHYGRNFDSEPDDAKSEWRQRFEEAHQADGGRADKLPARGKFPPEIGAAWNAWQSRAQGTPPPAQDDGLLVAVSEFMAGLAPLVNSLHNAHGPVVAGDLKSAASELMRLCTPLRAAVERLAVNRFQTSGEVALDERKAFLAWNNDMDCPLAGLDPSKAAWRAWQARALLSTRPHPTAPKSEPGSD